MATTTPFLVKLSLDVVRLFPYLVFLAVYTGLRLFLPGPLCLIDIYVVSLRAGGFKERYMLGQLLIHLPLTIFYDLLVIKAV